MLGVTHEIYAIISNTVIKELVATDYASATEIATTKYGSEAFATDVTHHPVQVGDEYVDGEFRRTNEDGTVSIIYYVPSYSIHDGSIRRHYGQIYCKDDYEEGRKVNRTWAGEV